MGKCREGGEGEKRMMDMKARRRERSKEKRRGLEENALILPP